MTGVTLPALDFLSIKQGRDVKRFYTLALKLKNFFSGSTQLNMEFLLLIKNERVKN